MNKKGQVVSPSGEVLGTAEEFGLTGDSASGGVAADDAGGSAVSSGGTEQPHAARVTTPLSLGVLDVSSYSAAAEGMGLNDSVAPSHAWADATKAMVRYFNSHGGIAGRRIELIEYTYDATDSSSWETHLMAACAKFTQDNDVEVVISVAVLFSDSYQTCLAKAGVINIEYGSEIDNQSYERYPSLVTVGALSVNRRIATLLKGLADRGFLAPKNKIGVIVEDCPNNLRAYAATFAPLARQLGLSILKREIDCRTGFGRTGDFISQVSSAVLPFKTAGVDRVIFVSVWEYMAILAFTYQARQQAYEPWYAITSKARASEWAGNWSKDALPRMVGIGHVPNADISERVLTSTATKRCRSAFASQGMKASKKADDNIFDITCDLFFLLEEGLTRSKGHANTSSLISSIASLDKSYVSPAVLGGATLYDAKHRDGPQLSSMFGYKESCSCFVYLSKPSRMG